MMVSIRTGAPSQVDERAQFSEHLRTSRLQQSAPDLGRSHASRRPAGYEIKLDGNSAADNTEVTIVQRMRFSGGNFIAGRQSRPRPSGIKVSTRFRAVRRRRRPA